MFLKRSSIADRYHSEADSNVEADFLRSPSQEKRDDHRCQCGKTGKPGPHCHPNLYFLVECHT